MPEEFSKIELDEPEDLDHVVSAIESHAIRLVKAQLEREKGTIGASAETEAVCRKVVEQWVKNMRQRLESNLLVNGLPYRESVKRGAVEPFDQALATRVQKLSQDVDNKTEEVIQMRKAIPARKEALIAARTRALDEMRASLTQRRQAMIDEYVKEQQKRPDDEVPDTVERSDEIQKNIKRAVSDVETLAACVLETESMTKQQTALVKRLRTMTG